MILGLMIGWFISNTILNHVLFGISWGEGAIVGLLSAGIVGILGAIFLR